MQVVRCRVEILSFAGLRVLQGLGKRLKVCRVEGKGLRFAGFRVQA